MALLLNCQSIARQFGAATLFENVSLTINDGERHGLIGQAPVPVLVSAKSPEAAIVLIVKAPAPVLVNVTGFAALVVVSIWPSKARDVGASPTPTFVPVPLRAMFCGLVLSPSVRTSVAVSAPATEGLNVTLMLQLAPTANEPAQVWV